MTRFSVVLQQPLRTRACPPLKIAESESIDQVTTGTMVVWLYAKP
jgi:hypothetical protein